jgi:hypothetical protein
VKSKQHLIIGVLLNIVLFPWTTRADDKITPAAAQFYREKVAPILAEPIRKSWPPVFEKCETTPPN